MNSPNRLLFIDGLRGVASMMVVFYHLYENLRPAVTSWFPSGLAMLFSHGNLGVDIFFVLSGFVITYSVRNGWFTWGYLGRFGLRRSIRLDPPLWATIILEILLIHAALVVFPSLNTPIPDWKQIAANLTYTQEFLGLGHVSPVFWSLTYEVQFYVVLVSSLVLAQMVIRASSRLRASSELVVAKLIFLIFFAYSLLIWVGLLSLPLRGLFIDRWFQFSLGIAACAVYLRYARLRPFLILCSATAALTLLATPATYRLLTVVVALVTAISLVLIGRLHAMDKVLNGRVCQFLGKISYSLYLIHLTIGWRFISLSKKALGPELGVIEGSAVFLAGVLVSVLAAWLMYIALEAPSVALARRVRLTRRPQPEAPATVPAAI